MAQSISEPSALFPHLESNDLHTVQEFKALIQDNLSSAREPFLYALVDFYIQTNSSQAQDILAGIREPLDKPLVDKLNECVRSSGARLPALTLLSHIVRRQPSWLHKIVQAPVFTSLIACLRTDTDIPVLMCGILMVTTLLPMIPSRVGPFLHDICEIFVRLASWNILKPGDVPDVYQLHLQAAVYALFHRLYGMYPWNFLEFLQSHFANKEKEFNLAILPMLERVRMHPQLIIGQKATETDLSRWRRMEVHDILMECARVSLDTTESTRDDRSTGSLMLSGQEMRSNVSSSCKMASPSTIIDALPSAYSQPPAATNQQTSAESITRHDPTSNLISSQAILSAMWSPSVDCGLTTPPSSHPPSPGGGSMMDQSLTSSMQMGYGDPSSSLTTPRDSPYSTLSEEQSHRLFNISEGNTPNKLCRRSGRKGPGPLPRHQNMLQRTTSAPSTPGYDVNAWLPASPIRKGSMDHTVFNFGTSRSQVNQQKARDGAANGSCLRSEQPLSKPPMTEDTLLEVSNEGVKIDHIMCPTTRHESQEDQETSVSLKDLPNVIKDLSAGHTEHMEQEVANNAEVISIVNSPQHDAEAFMSKVIAGLHQHKGGISESSHFVLNSTPKHDVEKLSKQIERGTAEGSDDMCLSSERLSSKSRVHQLRTKEGVQVTDGLAVGCVNEMDQGCNAQKVPMETFQRVGRTLSQQLFSSKATNGSDIEQGAEALSAEDTALKAELATGKEVSYEQGNGALSRQSSMNQGFTPIRDHSLESAESPNMAVNSVRHTPFTSESAQQAYIAFSHLYPLVAPHYPFITGSGLPISQVKDYDVSVASSETHSQAAPLHAVFSPTEILDRHIAMGDEVHDKELSRLPLTSQRSVNWTHYGGTPPADEINLLKGQLQLLHNQLLYERHKREVHAGRNRRLLGKTHKAKAFEELNSAMKDQLRLQEKEILRLSEEASLLRQENGQLHNECSHKDREFQGTIRKLESEKIHLRECNEELNKLLVTHKREVDKIKKDLRTTSASLFDMEQELASTKADVATNRHLKDEIVRLNKEILLLGEANVRLKERLEESKLRTAMTEEEERIKQHLMKELKDCHDAVKLRTIQLEASKSRITALDLLIVQKDRLTAEQKRYLESVKSLSNGKVEAVEAKYNTLKKVNQRQEAHILKLTKRLGESSRPRPRELARYRSNPDGAHLEDSSASSSLSRSGSNSPQKAFDCQSSSGSHGSSSSDKRGRTSSKEPQKPVGLEEKSSLPPHMQTFFIKKTVQTPSRAMASPDMRYQPHEHNLRTINASTTHPHSCKESEGHHQTEECVMNGSSSALKSPAIRFSEASPFYRVRPISSSQSMSNAGATQDKFSPHLRKLTHSTTVTSSDNIASLQIYKVSHNPTNPSVGVVDQTPQKGPDAPASEATSEVSSETPLAKTPVVDNIGHGMECEGIAAHLELDTSVEEHGVAEW